MDVLFPVFVCVLTKVMQSEESYMHPMFCCGCFSCLRRSLDLASACCVLRSPGLCVCGGAFFSAFAEWMRKQFKVKVAFSKR